MTEKVTAALVAAGLCTAVSVASLTAQEPAAVGGMYPELDELLMRIDRAHGMVLGRLAAEGDALRARADRTPTPGVASDLVDRLTTTVGRDGSADDLAAEAAAGYAVLGERGAEILTRGHAFQREVLGILASPVSADRRTQLREAVERYRSDPDVALPGAPKDMDVLYDHPYTFAFRTQYPDLAGFVWSGLWLKLATTEPLTDFSDEAERGAGVDTVRTRYHAKLSRGEPPQAFPSQIPLAPAIAPGFIYMSPEAAMIWDNLSLMQEVLADILASPHVSDVRTALDEAIAFFVDPGERVTERGEWESMALQHGIFFQGGYPLAVMTRSELNGDPHAAHSQAGGPTLMPRVNP